MGCWREAFSDTARLDKACKREVSLRNGTRMRGLVEKWESWFGEKGRDELERPRQCSETGRVVQKGRSERAEVWDVLWEGPDRTELAVGLLSAEH